MARLLARSRCYPFNSIVAAVATVIVLSPVMVVAQSTPTPEIEFRGEIGDDGFGRVAAVVGDVNGDGFDDYLFTAPGDDDVAIGSGQAYLFYGPLSGTLISASTADATVRGEALYDGLGAAAAGAGDVNNDGYDDLILGARSSDGGGIQSGRAYVFLGPLSGAYSAGNADAIITGDEFDELGWSVAGVGDTNGDGFDDVLIGSWMADLVGEALLFLGPVSGSLGASNANAVIGGGIFSEEVGYAVAGGDLNDDGLPDIIIGAPRPPLEGNDGGRIYAFFSPVSGSFPATAADLIINGEALNDEFGIHVHAGDVTGDGQDDLIVGAMQRFNGGPGKAYIFDGPISGTIAAGSADVIMLGEPFENAGHFGETVAVVGDVNNDGTNDIAVGAPSADASGIRSGRVYVFHAPLTGSIDAADADVMITGTEFDFLGRSIAGAGQDSGDPYDDLLVGAPGWFYDDYASGYAGLYKSEIPTGVPGPISSPRFQLRSYPTPFRSVATIRYELTQGGHAELAVYDVQGRRVRALVDGTLPAGPGEASWDGRDESGRELASGLYFVRLRLANDTETSKLVRIR